MTLTGLLKALLGKPPRIPRGDNVEAPEGGWPDVRAQDGYLNDRAGLVLLVVLIVVLLVWVPLHIGPLALLLLLVLVVLLF